MISFCLVTLPNSVNTSLNKIMRFDINFREIKS